jgi:hypothetical protein
MNLWQDGVRINAKGNSHPDLLFFQNLETIHVTVWMFAEGKDQGSIWIVGVVVQISFIVYFVRF